MGNAGDFDKICIELDNLEKVVKECWGVSRTKSNYVGMNTKELSMFYDKIEEGLISNNLILQNNSSFFKDIIEVGRKEDSPGKFLEAQLLSVVLVMMLKDSSLSVPSKYKDSLWISKIKDKEYYNKICDIISIYPKDRDSLYSVLHA
jgi:hypothetical protein